MPLFKDLCSMELGKEQGLAGPRTLLTNIVLKSTSEISIQLAFEKGPWLNILCIHMYYLTMI